MRPLPKGAARSALTEQIGELLLGNKIAVDLSQPEISRIASVLGGAIEESLSKVVKMYFVQDEAKKGAIKLFWKHFEYDLWSLVTSLKASNQLDKIK